MRGPVLTRPIGPDPFEFGLIDAFLINMRLIDVGQPTRF